MQSTRAARVTEGLQSHLVASFPGTGSWPVKIVTLRMKGRDRRLHALGCHSLAGRQVFLWGNPLVGKKRTGDEPSPHRAGLRGNLMEAVSCG